MKRSKNKKLLRITRNLQPLKQQTQKYIKTWENRGYYMKTNEELRQKNKRKLGGFFKENDEEQLLSKGVEEEI